MTKVKNNMVYGIKTEYTLKKSELKLGLSFYATQ